ncbi:MAG: DUF1360 domain-containing protein [Thermoleophilaceae bacterium]
MEQRAAIRTNGSGGQETSPGRDAKTQPADYAAINAVWVGLLGGLVAATRGRGSDDPIELRELVPLSAATFALSKAVARERIGTWVRDPFVDEEHDRRPRGGHLRRAVGELVTCTRCVGTWSALGVVGLRIVSPEAGRTVSTVLAASAANDWLQAAFKYLCEKTNKTATSY